MKRLKDKVFIMTGAARGIGAAGCKRMADEGALVAITDVLDDEGIALKDEIVKNGGEASYRHLDVSNEKQVELVFAAV
ncbi:MAG: SDR family NAD(P)-dependent oxidoreductase, partial [Bacteroidales bacterium]|nr:SDR family NAD(P)-dependent oxidoreductase [Bacteroidales bacterium]